MERPPSAEARRLTQTLHPPPGAVGRKRGWNGGHRRRRGTWDARGGPAATTCRPCRDSPNPRLLPRMSRSTQIGAAANRSSSRIAAVPPARDGKAAAFELPWDNSSRVPRSCLCTGCTGSSSADLHLIVPCERPRGPAGMSTPHRSRERERRAVRLGPLGSRGDRDAVAVDEAVSQLRLTDRDTSRPPG